VIAHAHAVASKVIGSVSLIHGDVNCMDSKLRTLTDYENNLLTEQIGEIS